VLNRENISNMHSNDLSPTEADITHHNQQNVQAVSKQAKARARLPKTHADYWKARLFRNTYTRDGEKHEAGTLSVKIQHLGRRETVPLHSANREAAAIKARDIYLLIVAKGWDAALAQFKPEMLVRKDDPTLGEFLAEVEAKSDLKARTFRNYAGYFRRIVADAFRVELFTVRKSGKKERRFDARFAWRNEQHKQWRSAVDSIKLCAITPDHLNDWRSKYIKEAGASPLARNSAIRSANSYLRCARALFSKKWLNRLKVRLPKPLPFDGVKIEKPRAPRYKSTIDPQLLLLCARQELKPTDIDAYLAFVLALGAGLRKGEIDGLEWKHVNFTRHSILVEPTELRDVKCQSSEAEVEIDPVLAEELRRCMESARSGFVIQSQGKISPGSTLREYRAEPVFERLYAWLRGKGITANKPLHTLRKEFGSMINARFGLYAAMTALRHANMETTSSHYTDNKRSIALPFAEMINPQPKVVNE
jgi:integrase